MASRFGGAVTRWIADPFYLGANPKAGSTSSREQVFNRAV